ncbi:patatin-like phospholipase family protein [Paenibacillus antri]|uniref:Patatin-like phospholipase family protein n=1 Tax=Paenibacillus antri TaxID=2582848 RepID=A0A5R9GHX7_9BACL|nr:patatin-like phospholipase family protein [Paenibacillus antri]TLS52978.1 patatin-like phospholipase family protein [Paenibacillus antri]
MRVNGVFQGGGVKGIGLVGAVYAAERRGITFHQTAGTSVGAIVAALLAAGYTGEEMRDLLLETPFGSFVQKNWFHYIYVVGPAIRLFLKKGLYSGDPLEEWIEAVLARKGIRTFADLPPNALRVVASDISLGKMLVLPEDIAQYGVDPMRFSVAKAVRMSCSLPFFFDPVKFRVKRREPGKRVPVFGKPTYIVDGAILSNYPLWIFDKDIKEWPLKVPTIGFQLVGSKDPGPRTIRGPITMLQALFSTMSVAHDLRYIERHSRFRTVKIMSDMVHTTEFSIQEDKLKELFESGMKAGDEFFSGWTFTGYSNELDQWIKKVRPELITKIAVDPSGPPAKKRV